MVKHNLTQDNSRVLRNIRLVGAACGLLVVLFGVVVGLWARWDYNREYGKDREPLPFPEGVPEDIILGDRNRFISGEPGLLFELWSRDADQPVAVPSGESVRCSIITECRDSYNGLWSGENAQVTITRPYTATYPARTHTDTWGSQLEGEQGAFCPWIVADLLVSEEDYHQELRLTASLDVVYPQIVSLTSPGSIRVGQFENRHVTVEQAVRLFVVSPAEYDTLVAHLDDYRDWQEWREDRDSQTANWLFVLVFFTGGGVIILVVALVNPRAFLSRSQRAHMGG